MYTGNIFKDYPGKTKVAICAKVPDGYSGPQYKALAPSWSIFSEYKKLVKDCSDHAIDVYNRRFKEEILSKLDPKETYDYLINNYGENCVLVCYEKPNQFCHRTTVAWWIKLHLDIILEEI